MFFMYRRYLGVLQKRFSQRYRDDLQGRDGVTELEILCHK